MSIRYRSIKVSHCAVSLLYICRCCRSAGVEQSTVLLTTGTSSIRTFQRQTTTENISVMVVSWPRHFVTVCLQYLRLSNTPTYLLTYLCTYLSKEEEEEEEEEEENSFFLVVYRHINWVTECLEAVILSLRTVQTLSLAFSCSLQILIHHLYVIIGLLRWK